MLLQGEGAGDPRTSIFDLDEFPRFPAPSRGTGLSQG